jgi:hypothetical protein
VRRRRVTFRIDEEATVVVKLRGRTRRTKTVQVVSGENAVTLPRMRPGRYSLSMRATDAAGNRSTVARIKFRVPKRKR